MENEKPIDFKQRKHDEICLKCGCALDEKYGIYCCPNPECYSGFMLPSTRVKAKEVKERVENKRAEYLKNTKILPVINEPEYEKILKTSADFSSLALFVEKDLDDKSCSTDFYIARNYLEFFQAAEIFEKLLDDFK